MTIIVVNVDIELNCDIRIVQRANII